MTPESNRLPLLAHIGRKQEITRGYVEGIAVRAICGAVIVPSRAPELLEPCLDCEQVWRVLFPNSETP